MGGTEDVEVVRIIAIAIVIADMFMENHWVPGTMPRLFSPPPQL